jgi:hypothetical protein
MIKQTTLNGRPVIVSYMDDKFQPVDQEQLATLLEVTFTDSQGGTLFLVPKGHTNGNPSKPAPG